MGKTEPNSEYQAEPATTACQQHHLCARALAWGPYRSCAYSHLQYLLTPPVSAHSNTCSLRSPCGCVLNNHDETFLSCANSLLSRLTAHSDILLSTWSTDLTLTRIHTLTRSLTPHPHPYPHPHPDRRLPPEPTEGPSVQIQVRVRARVSEGHICSAL